MPKASDVLFEEGNAVLIRPQRFPWVVMVVMARHRNQIFRPVVLLLAIEVMNDPGLRNRVPVRGFPHKAMFWGVGPSS